LKTPLAFNNKHFLITRVQMHFLLKKIPSEREAITWLTLFVGSVFQRGTYSDKLRKYRKKYQI